MERLDKRLAATGRWSRKEARELIRAGRVMVDGAPCRASEAKVDECSPSWWTARPYPPTSRYT